MRTATKHYPVTNTACGQPHRPFTPCPDTPPAGEAWAVYDANQDPERRIAVGGSKACAQDLRRLYLHVTPGANPRWVYLATEVDR